MIDGYPTLADNQSLADYSADHFIAGQPAYLIHQRPYRETSVIGEFFTLNHGRLPLLMRGMKRKPQDALQLFHPLHIEWCGRGALKILSHWEVLSGALALRDKSLYCGFYLNELLARLVPINEPMSQLFAFYHYALELLTIDQGVESVLRMFEKNLLIALGYYFECDKETDTLREVEDDAWYSLDIERGEVIRLKECRRLEKLGPDCFLGKTLKDFTRDAFDEDPKAIKRLARFWLGVYLGPQPIQSRFLFSRS